MTQRSNSPTERTRYRGFESVPVRIVVRVGRTRLSMARLSDLGQGQVLPLDRAVGSPFELMSGDVVLGRVEPVVSGQAVGVKLVSSENEDDESAD